MLLYGVDSSGNPKPIVINSDGGIRLSYAGASFVSRFSNVSSTAQLVYNGSSEIVGYNLINPNSTAVYLKFYNHAAPTVGTTQPIAVVMVPANGTVLFKPNSAWRQCSTAISIACVTSISDDSTTAPSTGLYCEIEYRLA